MPVPTKLQTTYVVSAWRGELVLNIIVKPWHNLHLKQYGTRCIIDRKTVSDVETCYIEVTLYCLRGSHSLSCNWGSPN